ncbi:MAG: phosphoglucosamine mutase [Candidatus Izemoplasmatales bacterium]
MNYFGTDGIRTKAEVILDKKIGYYIGKGIKLIKKNKKPVFIARDTRLSGEAIVKDIKKGLMESGYDVHDLGMFPTPVLAFFSFKKKTHGIMVTASHNPYYDNGIKIFENGKKIDSKQETLLEQAIDKELSIDKAETKGSEKEFKDPMDKYLKAFTGLLKKTSFKICLDLANGAAVKTAETVFKKITNDLIVIGNNPNGTNINEKCGSTDLRALQKKVIDESCDLGIAFDGDADRLLVVDNQGEVIDGDFIIYLFASYLKAHKKLKNKFVVLSKMCNIGIVQGLTEKNIDVIQTDVGDKYISKAIDENDGVLGGENSGHIINKRLSITGDGVLNAAFLIKVLNYYKLPISNLKQQVSYYPGKLVNIRDVDKSIVNSIKVKDVVNKYTRRLGDEGKILVRPSGTEPLIRVSVSARTEKLVDKIIDEVKKTIEEVAKEES